jgi:hypothetical protein
MEQIQKAEVEQKSSLILEEFEESKDKDNFYARLATNDTLDPDVKKSAISKVENHIGNLNRVKKKQAQVAHVAILGDMTNMEVAIKAGLPLPQSINDFVQSGMGYSPELDIQMMQYGRQLTLAKISGAKSNAAYTDFAAKRRQNELIGNSTANQKHLDTEIEGGYTPDMTEQAKDSAAIDVMRNARFVSFNWEEKFDMAASDAQKLGQIAPRWEELMLNTDINTSVQTKLSADKATVLTNTAKKIKAGIDPTVAGQQAIEISKMWARDKPEMEARQGNYTERPAYGDRTLSFGKRAALSGFDSYIDDSMDNSNWFFGFADPGQAEFLTEDLKSRAYANYEAYFYDAYMRTGDFNSATATANMMFGQNYNMNNINGEWQIEKNGAEGDQEWRLETFVTENSDETVIYGSGTTVTGKLSEIEEISFQRPYEVNDELRYEVWGPEGPIQKDVTVKGLDGKEKIDRQIVYETVTDEAVVTKELEDARKESADLIKGYEDDYNAALKAESFHSIYGRGKTQATIRDTEGKIEAERRKLKDKEAGIKGRPEFK